MSRLATGTSGRASTVGADLGRGVPSGAIRRPRLVGPSGAGASVSPCLARAVAGGLGIAAAFAALRPR